MTSPRRSLSLWLGGGAAAPVVTLTGLNLVDEFDRIAYATLTPEIRDAFGTSDAVVNSIATLSAVIVLVIAVPTGRLADRYPRVLLTWVCAVVWGAASLLTGLVPTIALLVVVRVASGIGRNANEIVHPSLLSDLYPPRSHPRVFMLHRLGNPTAQASGVLAGLIGRELGWEWAFILLSLPTFVLALAATRIEEPPRARLDADHRPIPVRDAFGELRALPSLRRLWAVAFFLAASAVGIFQLVSVYFEQIFGFDSQGRGIAQFVVGIGWVVGVLIGARLADGRTGPDDAHRLALIASAGLGVIAVGALMLAVAPNSAIALLVTSVMGVGNGIWQAPYFSAVSQIAPPGLSGQAFSSSTVFYALGALVSVPLFIFGDSQGYRPAFMAVAVLATIAMLLGRTVAPLISADLRRAADA